MPNFFQKLKSGAGNFFKKVDNGASNFFKKLPDAANNIANKVINPAIDVAKKAGNFLEKNSGAIGGAAAGLAEALGQPELALAIGAGTLQAQNMGNKLNRVTNQVNNFKTQGLDKINTTTNQLVQKQDQIRNIVSPVLGLPDPNAVTIH